MMSTIRKHMKSKGFQLIIWISLLSVLSGGGIAFIFKNLFKKEVEGVASVNGYNISSADFQRSYIKIGQIFMFFKQQLGDKAADFLKMMGIDATKEPYEIALDQLIEQKALEKNADSIIKSISKNIIQAKLNDPFFISQHLSSILPPDVFDTQGKLKFDILAAYLQRQGVSEDEFENLLIQILKRDLLSKLIEFSVYIPKFYIKEKYITDYAKRKYSLTTLPMEKYVNKAQSEKLSDDEIQDYFEKHKAEYKVPEKRSGILWAFKPENFGLIISDKAMLDYYNKNKKLFIKEPAEVKLKRILVPIDKKTNLIEARKKIQEIEEQIKEHPEAFDQFAQPDVMTIKKGQSEPLFEQAAFTLASPDSISGIIKTTQGFELIKLVEKKDASYKQFDGVKSEIKNKLLSNKFETLFNSDASRILKQSKDDPQLFDKFIENKKAAKEVISPVEKAVASSKSQKLFGLKNKGSRSFFIEDKVGYIIELSQIAKSFVPDLESVKDKVIKDLYSFKASKYLEDALKDEKALADADTMSTEWIDPKDSKSLKIFRDRKIPVDVVLSLSKENDKTEFMTDKEGVLITLKELAPFDQEDFEKKKSLINKELINEISKNLTEGYIKHLTKKAVVTINEPLIRQLSRVEL